MFTSVAAWSRSGRWPVWIAFLQLSSELTALERVEAFRKQSCASELPRTVIAPARAPWGVASARKTARAVRACMESLPNGSQCSTIGD